MSLVTGRSRRRAGMLASVAAAGLLAAASVLAASYAVAGKPAGGNGAIVGTWVGRVAQWGDLPSVDLYVSEKGGKLSGRATFYLIKVREDGQREVGGMDNIDLIEPSFDGRRLAFKIKDPNRKIHSVELRLTGEGQADYVEVGSGAGDEGHKPDLLVKMKRK